MSTSQEKESTADIIFAREFIPTEEADGMLQVLSSTVPWKQQAIKMFGKSVMQPRLTCWMGDPGANYKYSGLSLRPEHWTPELMMLKKLVEDFAGHGFNSALLNFYRDGRDSMGWHRDNEPELGVNPVITSLSFGASREFRLRHYFDKSLKKSFLLEHGSLLVMKGETQHFWEHSIPKVRKSQWLSTGPRVNITFRWVRC